MRKDNYRKWSNKWYFISVFIHGLKCKQYPDGHSLTFMWRKLKNYVKINIIHPQMRNCLTSNNILNALKLNTHLGFWVRQKQWVQKSENRRLPGLHFAFYWSLKKGIINWRKTRRGASKWITNELGSQNNAQLPPWCCLLSIIIQPKPDEVKQMNVKPH